VTPLRLTKATITSTHVGSSLNRLRNLFLALIALGLYWGMAAARAESVLSLSYFQDPSHQMRVEELAAAKFKPIPSEFALGFTQKTTWIRVNLNSKHKEGQYYLSVWPPRLEKIQLFAQMRADNSFMEVNLVPESNRIGNVYFDAFQRNVFDLSAYRDASIFYLKIDTDNSLNGEVSLLTQENIDNHRASEGFLLGGVAFGLTPFLIIFLALALYKKQAIYRVYLFTLLSTTLLYLTIYGFDWMHLVFGVDVSLDHQVGLLGIINITFSYAFLIYICEILGTPKNLIGKLKTFIFSCFLLCPIYALVADKQIVLEVFYTVALLLTFLIIFLIVFYSNKKSTIQWMIAVLFLIISLGSLKVFLSLLGILPNSDNVFSSLTTRILTIPFALLVLVGYYEMENNRYVLNLVLEKTLAEQHKRFEFERRRVYESFIAMLVHEIKTPLSIIQIAASSLSRHLSENAAEINRINNIKKSVTEINQIFNKCIQVVDIENDSVSLEASEFSVHLLLEDLERTIDNKRFKLTNNVRLKLNTDFVLLKTVLVNLVSNGLKYGKEDEDVVLKINVHTTEQGNHLEFKITNPIGVVGIPNSEQLFQRYYRSESAKRYAGSGLGLWLSRELAKILGGNIVYNHDDTHIHFSFSITGNA